MFITVVTATRTHQAAQVWSVKQFLTNPDTP